MNIYLEERFSDSPFIERVWRSQTEEAGVFTSIAASHWGLTIWEEQGKTSIAIRGPETLATLAPVPPNSPSFGIVFKLGVFMPHLPIQKLVDQEIIFPKTGNHTFWLGSSIWQLPTYDNLDTFVNRLVRQDLLVQDSFVASVLQGQFHDLSDRSLQRRFLRATGITHTAVHQIERARYATLLLQNGTPILDVVEQAGYYDQPHLTKLLKRYIGQTPAQLADKNSTEPMSHLYKTSFLW